MPGRQRDKFKLIRELTREDYARSFARCSIVGWRVAESNSAGTEGTAIVVIVVERERSPARVLRLPLKFDRENHVRRDRLSVRQRGLENP